MTHIYTLTDEAQSHDFTQTLTEEQLVMTHIYTLTEGAKKS